MSQVKPCPFCGEGEKLTVFPKDPGQGVSQQVRCAKCNALATLRAWEKQGAYAELLSDVDKEIESDCDFKKFKKWLLKRKLNGKCLN